ncbi:MAG: N-acetylmuramoyl-L-alanine amidase-like domain-containing protein [Myxococcota bacterium]
MVWLWLVIGAGGAGASGAPDLANSTAAPEVFPEDEGAGGALPGGPDVALDAPLAGSLDPGAVAAAPTFVPVERGPERWTPGPGVISAIREARTRTLGERVEIASRGFLGLPYLNDAAGEGLGIDADPPSRYDAFDCLTFVEEVLGLALAGDPIYAPAVRDALRYTGGPAYDHRRHFMEAQWIPDAIRNGLLEDITARVGRARELRKDVTPEVWRRWRRRGLFQLPDAVLPLGEWTLHYLDLAEAVAAVPRIPAGALVVTLREERAWSPVVVTHISMVVPPAEGSPPGAELRMRHATRMGRQTVRDDRLGWYAAHLRDYVNWPALGITVLMPREQGPRISALTTPTLPDPYPLAEGALPAFVPQPLVVVPGAPGAVLGASAGAVEVTAPAPAGAP